jgi:hypothetical protein
VRLTNYRKSSQIIQQEDVEEIREFEFGDLKYVGPGLRGSKEVDWQMRN